MLPSVRRELFYRPMLVVPLQDAAVTVDPALVETSPPFFGGHRLGRLRTGKPGQGIRWRNIFPSGIPRNGTYRKPTGSALSITSLYLFLRGPILQKTSPTGQIDASRIDHASSPSRHDQDRRGTPPGSARLARVKIDSAPSDQARIRALCRWYRRCALGWAKR
jgi:hypothetical protein